MCRTRMHSIKSARFCQFIALILEYRGILTQTVTIFVRIRTVSFRDTDKCMTAWLYLKRKDSKVFPRLINNTIKTV